MGAPISKWRGAIALACGALLLAGIARADERFRAAELCSYCADSTYVVNGQLLSVDYPSSSSDGGIFAYSQTTGERVPVLPMPAGYSFYRIGGGAQRALVHGYNARGPVLWVTDGTTRGSRLLARFGYQVGDIRLPDAVVGSEQQLKFLTVPYYFPAPLRLWTTDGTRAGMRPQSALDLGPNASVSFALQLNGRLIFLIENDDYPNYDEELWSESEDGTLQKLQTYPRNSVSRPWVTTRDSAYFTCGTNPGSTALWRTDGTAEGTNLLRDLTAGKPSGLHYATTLHGGESACYAEVECSSQCTAIEHWVSDGTPEGTHRYTIPGLDKNYWHFRGEVGPSAVLIEYHEPKSPYTAYYTYHLDTQSLVDLLGKRTVDYDSYSESTPRLFAKRNGDFYFSNGLHGVGYTGHEGLFKATDAPNSAHDILCQEGLVYTFEIFDSLVLTATGALLLSSYDTSYSLESFDGFCRGEETGERAEDVNHNHVIEYSELTRVRQFYHAGGYHCAQSWETSRDGYVTGPGFWGLCEHLDPDFREPFGEITLDEVLREVQFYNAGGYHYCPDEGTEDGYCLGP